MFRGNKDKVYADAPGIVGRLRKTKVTLGALCDEYSCGYETMVGAILTQIDGDEYDALMRKRLGRGGKAHWFRKHHTPWNQGRKGWCPEKCRATQFRPGTIRGAAARKYRKVGSVTIRRDVDKGVGKPRKPRLSRWIKVRDDGPRQDRYIPLARYLWERQHGPVPEGFFVVHADNDTMNDSLENLILVDRKELMARLYDRPEVIAKCRARAGKATKKRHAQNRTAKRAAKFRQKVARTIWECRDCGAEYPAPVSQCRKCGGPLAQHTIEPMPESMQQEACLAEGTV